MKRFWLTICLTALIICVAGIGVYREANHKITQFLTRLEESLPADQHFSYKKAVPALFIGGATLYDVSFQTPTITFHADKIRLGHTHFLHDGSVSLSSLRLDQPNYQGPEFNLHSSKAVFRHLLIPSSKGDMAPRTDFITTGIHSLAAVMSFNPQNLSTLHFGRAHVGELDFTFPPHHTFLHSALNLSHIHVGTFILEGYGIGPHVLADIKHVSLALTLSKGSTTAWPIPLANLLLPNTAHTLLPITLTFNSLRARRGHIRWLQHPFQGDFELSEQFQKNPLQSFWESPGSFRLHALALTIGSDADQSQVLLDHLIATRRNEAATLRTEAELRGFHVQPSHQRHFSMPINGTKTTLRFNEMSRKSNELWQNTTDYTLTFPNIGILSLNTQTHTPIKNPFQKISHSHELTFAQKAFINKAHLSLKGERFPDLWLHFLNPATSKQEWEEQHDDLLHRFGTIITTRPLLTPMLDYILSPKGRTLDITFNTLSLDDINNLPFTAPINALLDAAHITSVTVN